MSFGCLLSPMIHSFSSFGLRLAAIPDLFIVASSVSVYSDCPPTRILLCSVSHPTPQPICISGLVWEVDGKGQKASKLLAQELRDPEPFHVALERGLSP